MRNSPISIGFATPGHRRKGERPRCSRRREFADSATGTAPIVAVPLGDDWLAASCADTGAWSRDAATWQGFASLGYRFNERWSAQVGQPHTHIKKEIGNRDDGFALSGPLIFATVKVLARAFGGNKHLRRAKAGRAAENHTVAEPPAR